jgi:hypothetical protein
MCNLYISHDFKSISWLVELLIIVFLITGFTGCSTNLPQTPDYFATDIDSHVPEIKRVALVTDLTPPKIESVYLGVTPGEGASKMAAEGALTGATYSLIAGPGYFIVLPFFVTAGVVGGAASGAVSGYPADMLAEAEAQAKYILDSAYLQNKLLAKVEEYGNDQADIEFIRMPSADQDVLLDEPDYSALTDESIDAVLEVELISLILKRHSGSSSSQLSRLILDSRIRLVSVHTGIVLSDNQYKFFSLYNDLETWIDNDATVLESELQRGLQRLAEDAIDENFLLFYPNFPDDINMSFWGMSTTPYVLNPTYPEPECDIGCWYVDIDTLQPTFKWESFPRDYDLTDVDGQFHDITDVRYELRIFSPGGIKQIYYVRDLLDPYHKIQSRLDACTRYIWTVRARFKLDGRPRATEWAAAFNAPGWNEKPWNLRRGKYWYAVHGPEWFYYKFETPCDSEIGLDSDSSTSIDEDSQVQ